MINNFLKDISEIYIACGATDFRKQIDSLCNIIRNEFNINANQNKCAFIFCNRRRNSIKVLCYDKNGFILLQKKLLNCNNMKFQWPRNKKEIKNINQKQLSWLLEGLKLEYEKSFDEINLNEQKIVI